MIKNTRIEKDSVVVFYNHGQYDSTHRFDLKATKEDYEKWDKERQVFLDEREEFIMANPPALMFEPEEQEVVKILKARVVELEATVTSKEARIRTLEVASGDLRIR